VIELVITLKVIVPLSASGFFNPRVAEKFHTAIHMHIYVNYMSSRRVVAVNVRVNDLATTGVRTFSSPISLSSSSSGTIYY
jgi:nucleoside diphosphate kinase